MAALGSAEGVSVLQCHTEPQGLGRGSLGAMSGPQWPEMSPSFLQEQNWGWALWGCRPSAQVPVVCSILPHAQFSPLLCCRISIPNAGHAFQSPLQPWDASQPTLALLLALIARAVHPEGCWGHWGRV